MDKQIVHRYWYLVTFYGWLGTKELHLFKFKANALDYIKNIRKEHNKGRWKIGIKTADKQINHWYNPNMELGLSFYKLERED